MALLIRGCTTCPFSATARPSLRQSSSGSHVVGQPQAQSPAGAQSIPPVPWPKGFGVLDLKVSLVSPASGPPQFPKTPLCRREAWGCLWLEKCAVSHQANLMLTLSTPPLGGFVKLHGYDLLRGGGTEPCPPPRGFPRMMEDSDGVQGNGQHHWPPSSLGTPRGYRAPVEGWPFTCTVSF